MKQLTEAQRRKAAQEAYARRVKQGRVDNTYLNFDDWYDRYALTDVLFLSIISEMENENNISENESSFNHGFEESSSSDSSYEDTSSYSSDSSSYDSGSYDSGGSSDSSY